MSDKAEKKKILNTLLKAEGSLFVIVGSFFATKQFFSEIIVISQETDFTLGCGLIIVGFINIFIANKFFGKDVK